LFQGFKGGLAPPGLEDNNLSKSKGAERLRAIGVEFSFISKMSAERELPWNL